MMGMATFFTAFQSTPKSRYCQTRSRPPGSAKQVPLLAASPSPGTFPTATSKFCCESPDTTYTVFRGSAHSLRSASAVTCDGRKPLVPSISRLRYFPAGSLTTSVPLKSMITTRVRVAAYAPSSAVRSSRSNPSSASRASIESGELSPTASMNDDLCPPPSVASFRSLRTLRVHSPEGLVDTKSMSRPRRASRSLNDMESAQSMDVTHIAMS
mmetsp:Transcript_34347/g.83070  ORF Transcript_34347/g.83070 Transcript_34347/m.83070 type:complete len:212 (-) Transcript_34347:833-1468(-)